VGRTRSSNQQLTPTTRSCCGLTPWGRGLLQLHFELHQQHCKYLKTASFPLLQAGRWRPIPEQNVQGHSVVFMDERFQTRITSFLPTTACDSLKCQGDTAWSLFSRCLSDLVCRNGMCKTRATRWKDSFHIYLKPSKQCGTAGWRMKSNLKTCVTSQFRCLSVQRLWIALCQTFLSCLAVDRLLSQTFRVTYLCTYLNSIALEQQTSQVSWELWLRSFQSMYAAKETKRKQQTLVLWHSNQRRTLDPDQAETLRVQGTSRTWMLETWCSGCEMTTPSARSIPFGWVRW